MKLKLAKRKGELADVVRNLVSRICSFANTTDLVILAFSSNEALKLASEALDEIDEELIESGIKVGLFKVNRGQVVFNVGFGRKTLVCLLPEVRPLLLQEGNIVRLYLGKR